MGALGTSSANLDSEGHFIVAQECREKIFFDEGASCLCFVGVEGTCIFSRGYLAYLRGYPRCTRVPDLFLIFMTACFTELWWRKRGNKLVDENFVVKNNVSCQINCAVSI